jgi:hypothetical protein
MIQRLLNAYTYDLRAFSLFRICLATVVGIDLGIRFTDLEAHYTDQGVLPLKALFEYCWNDYHFSIHAMNGLWQFQMFLFGIHFLAAICLFFGYRTKTANIVCWLMMCSLHSRNPMILQGGDDLLRMGLFWGMFLPLNRFYSIDANNDKRKNEFTSYQGIAGFICMCQLAYVYFFSALEKNSAEWHEAGTALYYALSFEQVSWGISKYIYHYPQLLNSLTHIAWFTEMLAPLLYFIPIRNQFFRFAAICVLVVFHLSISSMLFVGLFSIIAITMHMAMLPSFAMNRFDSMTMHLRYFFYNIFRFRTPAIITHTPKSWSLILVSFFGVYVLAWNISNAPQLKYGLSPQVRWIGYLLRLDQNWGVFAPGVIKDDGWYVLPALTLNGDSIDVYRNGNALDYSKPKQIVA